MKIEHTALSQKGFIDKSLGIEKLENGNYRITAYQLPVGNKKERSIIMEYTQNGMNALIGGMMAVSKEG